MLKSVKLIPIEASTGKTVNKKNSIKYGAIIT